VRVAILLAITALLAASCSSSGSALKHEQAHKHRQALKSEEALKREDASKREEAIRAAVLKHDLALKAQAAHALVAPTTTLVTTTSNPEAPSPLTIKPSTATTNPQALTPVVTPSQTKTRPAAPKIVTPPVTTVHRHGRHVRPHRGHHQRGPSRGGRGSPSHDLPSSLPVGGQGG